MSKDHSGKIRRHTYSMPQLRIQAQLRSDRRLGNIEAFQSKDLEGWERAESGWREEWGDYEDWQRIEGADVGWPSSMLPEGARAISFSDLALDLAADPRGYYLLEGYERGTCGLDQFLAVGWDRNIGGAFSFCVNGSTYTAFENPADGYRSRMGLLVAREGNWCSTPIEPCAVLPRFCRTSYDWSEEVEPRKMHPAHEGAGHGDALELIDPSSMETALMVGTSRADDYYPSFVGYARPETVQKALDSGVAENFALADELTERLAEGHKASPKRSRL